MSFAKTVKEELVSVPIGLEEQLAEFSAFLNLHTEFHIENKHKMLDFKTNNPTVAKRFLQLVRTLYQAETSLMTQKQTKLKQKQTVIIRVQSKVEDIVSEHNLLENAIESQELLTQSPDAKKAYLRAAFLASGSVNHPRTAEYHLELYSSHADHIIFIQQLLNHFELNARVTKRRNGYIAYLKDAEGISDFLQIVGAQNSVFKFEDIRIKRDFNNSINRVMNCEIANEKKTIVASNQQIKDIKLIEKYMQIKDIDQRLLNIMELRKNYPDISLRELSEYYEDKYDEPLSKSGLNHRLAKIKKLAEHIRESRQLK